MKYITLLSLISSFFLTGCYEDSVAGVEQKMADIRKKPAKEVDSLPVFEQARSFNYSANNFRSPFMPPTLSERLAEQQAIGNANQPDEDRPRDPLELFDLSQLAMKGVIQDTTGEIYALIEDPTGTVMKISVGMHMGKNNGRVVDINPRQVELIEVVDDGKKGWIERPRSLVAAEG